MEDFAFPACTPEAVHVILGVRNLTEYEPYVKMFALITAV
jgi:hypothetical protein